MINAARRAFLRGAGRATPVARPPGAVSEPDFLAACTRCRACILACPPALLIDGDAGWPQWDFRAGECDFCGDCIIACPEGALRLDTVPLSPWVAAIGESCLGAQGIVCHSCLDACAVRAIRLQPGEDVPELSADGCIGCGGCVSVCPAGAIGMQAPPRDVHA